MANQNISLKKVVQESIGKLLESGYFTFDGKFKVGIEAIDIVNGVVSGIEGNAGVLGNLDMRSMAADVETCLNSISYELSIAEDRVGELVQGLG